MAATAERIGNDSWGQRRMLSGYSINSPDTGLAARARAMVDSKTKPRGSLGKLERLAVVMAAAQNDLSPSADPAHLLLFAGDHGIAAEGVSAWPSEVTTQMVANFLAGGAAANVFARTNGIEITIADAGILGELPESGRLRRAAIAKGTRNFLHEDAMTGKETEAALNFGAELARECAGAGVRTILLGEMGIGNTSSATMLAHAIDGIPIAALAGPGAGLDRSGVARKVAILEAAAQRLPGPMPPMRALAAFGGLELAAIAGALIGGAASGAIILVDGFIATAAALCALRARPEAQSYCVFAHRSQEPGHRLVLEALGADPLIDLDLRLGEGTGALLALPLLRNACAMLNEMATFETAGVSGKTGS